MTDAELEEIRRVWAEATPGPWEFVGTGFDVAQSGGCFHAGTWVGSVIEVDHDGGGWSGCGGYEFLIREQDAKAIASAPTHIAALLAEVDRLRAELADAIPRAGLMQTIKGMWGEMGSNYIERADLVKALRDRADGKRSDCEESEKFELVNLAAETEVGTFPPPKEAKDGE